MMTTDLQVRKSVVIFAVVCGMISMFFAGRILGQRDLIRENQGHHSGERFTDDQAVTEGDQDADDAIPYGDDALEMTPLVVDWILPEQQKAEPVDPKFFIALKDQVYTGEDGKGSWMYKIGTITSPYAGDALYEVVAENIGLGPQYQYFYLITDYGSSGQVTVVNRYAGNEWGMYAPNTSMTADGILDIAALDWKDVKDASDVELTNQVTIDRDVYIPEFGQAPGGVITAGNPNGKESYSFVVLGVGARMETDPRKKDHIVARMEDDGFLYASTDGKGKNIFYEVRDDGRFVWYDLSLPFLNQTSAGEPVAVPAITWTDGSKNTQDYTKAVVGGCGFSYLTNVVDKDELGELVQIGTTQDGPVYGQANQNSDLLATAFASWGTQYQDKTYADYLALHPFFYYQDALGRWIQFQNTQVMPAGECGKPVIYLYPTTTQDLTVQLSPQGGFTKSEPAYGNGWHVKATPAGVLTNLADGKSYSYLFWEGRGGLYQEPASYWVVAKKDVHGFLTSTLAKLGLNAKETADFEEFWEPRMTSATYYKIGFHGTDVMNAIAPMTLSQKPATLIRVLMDYSPLSAPMAQKPPTLPKTPVRTGFTVIEWGGVIR